MPQPVPFYVYPIPQWVAEGALVLRPNYRGSAGYGEAFRALNVKNLGVGDMWDVMSGVESLVARGIVDTTRMGAMGWSQGGYISAFLTTNTSKFKAISVGAGISNWVTYYVATDIHPFTRQYLKATPVGRSGHLREDVGDDQHQAGEDADTDSARRVRSPGADPERVRAVPGAPGRRRADQARGLQGIRPRDQQAEGAAGGGAAQLGVVWEVRAWQGARRRRDGGGWAERRRSADAGHENGLRRFAFACFAFVAVS